MNASALPVLRLVVDFGLVVLIWLVQLIIYPSFRHVDPALFGRWHASYMHLISFFVIPLMFAQVGLTGWAVLRDPGAWNLMAVAGVLAAWASTFIWSAPCHAQLQTAGHDLSIINRLVGTNWVRTSAWTAVFLAAWQSTRFR